MKRLFVTLTFIVLSIANALAEDNFDFSAVCGSGQTLYYQIVAPNAVEITYPNVTDNWEYMYDGYTRPTGDLTIPDTVINNGVKYAVKSIGQDAFNSCSDITSVNIPNSITSICQHAFIGCNNITSVVVPNSVTDIGFGAFYACDLTTISLPFVGDKRHEPTDKYQYPFGYIFGAGNYSGGTQTGQSYYGNSNTTTTSATYCIPTYLKEVIITGSSYIPHFAFNNCKGVTSITIPDTITKIGDLAFSECVGLTSIAIPNSVSSIGVCAFANCSNLKTVNIPEGITTIERGTFERCDNLSLIIIPNSVTSLEQWAFYDCHSLKNVFIPKTVTSISIKAFNNATIYCEVVKCPDGWVHNSSESNWYENSTVHWGIKKVKITEIGAFIPRSDEVTDGVNYFAGGCNKDTIVIPDSVVVEGKVYAVKGIGAKSFSGCGNLKSVTIPNTVISIGDDAFSACSNLTSITIPNSVKRIGAGAFFACTGLKSITIPNSVTSIDIGAFSACCNLKSITLPFVGDKRHEPTDDYQYPFGFIFGTDNYVGSVATQQYYLDNSILTGTTYYIPETLKEVILTGGDCVPHGAFLNCSGLTSVSIPTSVTSIGAQAFYNCSNLTSVIIPDSVTILGNSVFERCSSLKSVIIPNSVTDIGYSTFEYCSSLASVTIGKSVTSIGNTVFDGCSKLSSITIPNSVRSIGKWAFRGCSVLNSITIENQTPPSLGDADALKSGIPIYIPCGSLSAYQSAENWSNYSFVEKMMYKFEISSSDSDKGSVEIMREPTCEKSAVIQATAETGYVFEKWSDGNKSNPRYLTVTQDTALVAYFVVDEVEAEIASANTAQGTVSNSSGTYHYNDEIEISATANYGYTFAKWSDGVTTNPRTVVLKNDTVIRAEFAVNQYTITLKPNIAERGTVSGGGTFNYLSNNKISATANTGYVFANWNDGNTANPRTVALTQDTAFTAVFVPAECALQVSSTNAAMGTVSNSSGTYYFNDEVEISATPNYGYYFTCWNDSVTANPRTVTITKDTAFTANFAENQYTITVKENIAERGTVSGNGSFNYLTNNKITATPNYGYVFEKWSDGNTDNPRTVALTKDTAFTAVFVQKDFTLSATSANTALGSVTGGGTIKYRETAEITATATAAHHHFVAWSDGNRQNPRTVQVVSDTQFVATFAIDSFTVAATSRTEEFGAVSGGGLYAYGTAVEVKAQPQPHCHLVEWSNGASGLVQQFDVEKDTTFNAAFAIDTHNLRATVADSTMGVATGSGTYDYATAVTLTATAAAGCYFTGWSDGVTANPRILTISGDTIVTAQFGRLQEFGITVVPSDEARGTVAGTGRYQSGTEATLSATASEHYYFSQWSDGRTDNPRRVRVIADATYTAVFEPEQYSVTLSQNNADMGMVSGSGQYRYGDMVSCLAKPYQNYHFVQWSNGSTANPYEFVIESNQLLTAYFAAGAVTGIEEDAATEPIIYAVGKTIVVENATNEILVYDAMGRIVGRDVARNVCTISINNPGVYVVKVGNTVKRVAVE